MIRKTLLSLSLLVLSATSLLSARAYADSISLSLTNPVITASAGSTVSFEATVTALGSNASDIFLNSDSFNLSSPLSLDDTAFFTTFAYILAPGDTYTGILFTVTVPPDAATGLYPGSFSILGGSDSGASDILGQLAFEVDIPTAAAVPEPGSLLLLATGLPGVAAILRSKRDTFRKRNG